MHTEGALIPLPVLRPHTELVRGILPVPAVGGVAWVASPRGLSVVLFFSCVTNFLCYTLFGNALRYTSAATATTVTLAEGAVGTLLGGLRTRRTAGPRGMGRPRTARGGARVAEPAPARARRDGIADPARTRVAVQ